MSCDDGNPCTTDRCDEPEGCLYEANDGASCDDGNGCTGGDACAGTACRGTAIPGCCATSDDCDDTDGCTIDRCVDGGCANEPRDCTVADKGAAGFCDALTGACDTAPLSCDDSNVCTDDFCDSATGCYSLPTMNPPQATEISCAEGADNDCDGLVDSDDPDFIACGDGVAQANEQCDQTDLKGQTCETVPGTGATGNHCYSSACTLLVGTCRLCGNGIQVGNEACDGTPVAPGCTFPLCGPGCPVSYCDAHCRLNPCDPGLDG